MNRPTVHELTEQVNSAGRAMIAGDSAAVEAPPHDVASGSSLVLASFFTAAAVGHVPPRSGGVATGGAPC
jgi:hypothetical protein